jgi:hypothetical protein
MKPVLISFNEQLYKQKIAAFETYASIMQKVVETFAALTLPALTIIDLQSLFHDPVSMVFDKMTNGQPVSIAGLQVDKIKAMELLIKPGGYEELLDTVAESKKAIAHHQYDFARFNISSIADCFDMVDGAILLKPLKEAELKESCNAYAKTDNAKKMLAFTQTIVDKANELGVRNLIHAHTFKYILSGIDPEKDQLTVNPDAIVRFNDPLFNRF